MGGSAIDQQVKKISVVGGQRKKIPESVHVGKNVLPLEEFVCITTNL